MSEFDEMQEILEEFFTEADEGLDNLESGLIKLESLAENGEKDPGTVDELFRVLHTLKGGAGFLGLEKMAKLAHAGENLLDEVRASRVEVTKEVMDALLKTNDTLKELLEVSKAGEEPDMDNKELIATLEALTLPQETKPKADEAPNKDAEAVAKAVQDQMGEEEQAAEEKAEAAQEIDPNLVNQDLLNEVMGDESLNPELDKDGEEEPAEEVDGELVNQELLQEVMGDESLNPELDKDEDEEPVQAVAEAAPVEDKKVEEDKVEVARGTPPPERRQKDDRRQDERRQASRRKSDAEVTIRVETGRLDKVMNLVGELVLARNSLLRQLNKPEAKEVLNALSNFSSIQENMEIFSRVTQDLQMSVLSTRMQPIKKVFDKIPRQVRELKNSLGKEINLVIEGEMTEVDKTLVEELSDPMVHLIRNSLDHGIETPDIRKENGKNPEGTLKVKAFYEGNNVVIEVVDDGKGIDPDVIRSKAVEKGMIDEYTAQNMPDEDATRLILQPGFSTAEAISDVSGRGVGMDVVNAKISSVKGTLDIRSKKGEGTIISIYLPLTLAIMQALMVESNEEGFAIPIGDISEVIKFNPADVHKVNDQDVIELRGDVLPLFYLSKLTKKGFVPIDFSQYRKKDSKQKAAEVAKVEPKASEEISLDDLEAAVGEAVSRPVEVAVEDATPAVGTDNVVSMMGKNTNTQYIIVVRDGMANVGVVVDALVGQEEAVVKPVTELFDYNEAISGATITGDGTVHMILDIPYLMKEVARKGSF